MIPNIYIVNFINKRKKYQFFHFNFKIKIIYHNETIIQQKDYFIIISKFPTP